MKYNIFKTENYLIIVDDLEIKEGEYYLSKISNDVFRRSNGGHWIENYDKKMYQKIIAHLPLNNSPILDGVDLLPPLKQDDEVEKMAELNGHPESSQFYDYKEGFIDGFLEAKEKYKWTDEDVIKIVEKSRETGLTAEYLMLSLFQPKYPITFECEMEEVIIGGFIDGKDEAVTLEKENKPKTTTNSQGQTILVGKYIY